MNRKKQLGQQRRIEEEKLEQLEIQTQHLKRKFIGATAGLAIFLTLGYTVINSHVSKSQGKSHERPGIDFIERESPDQFLLQARTNANVRQAYLDRLVSSNEIPYSSGIVYDEDGTKGRVYIENLLRSHNVSESEVEAFSKKLVSTGNFNARVHEIFLFKGEGIKPPIFAGRLFFTNSNSTSREIKHILKYHEARHAELFSRGYGALSYLNDDILKKEFKDGKITHRVLYNIGELDALTSEFSAIESGESKVSRELYENNLSDYRKIRRTLMKTIPASSPIQAELINRALKLNPTK